MLSSKKRLHPVKSYKNMKPKSLNTDNLLIGSILSTSQTSKEYKYSHNRDYLTLSTEPVTTRLRKDKKSNSPCGLLNQILEESKNYNEVETDTYEKYSDFLNDNMVNYRNANKVLKYRKRGKEGDTGTKFITPKEQRTIEQILSKDKSERKLLESIKENNILKVKFNEMNYRNPFHSLGIIKNNNNIYNKITSDSIRRQRNLFDQNVKKFESLASMYKVKMPEIKVMGITPKIEEEIPIVDMNAEEDNNNILPKDDEGLKLFAYFQFGFKNSPEGRTQFTIFVKGNSLGIAGGLLSNIDKFSLWTLSIRKLEWSKIETKNESPCRYGHSSVLYQNKLYILGGKIKTPRESKLGDLEVFNFQDKTFSVPETITPPCPPPERRNHVSLLVGNQMFIHGGMGGLNEVFNDSYILNLNPLKWAKLNIDKDFEGPKLFGHSVCLAMPEIISSHYKFSIYNIPEPSEMKKIPPNKIKFPGLYIFGGKPGENEQPKNDLWYLKLGEKVLEWRLLNTEGMAPTPRYFHSMDFYEKMNFIIIHGGRNDNLSKSCALNDTFILDLELLHWVKVVLYSSNKDFKVLSRYGHQSVIYSNKLIILGGMNNHNYLGSSLFIVNLDVFYSPIVKSKTEFAMMQLKDKKDHESRLKMKKMKEEAMKNPLGVVRQLNLPPIK